MWTSGAALTPGTPCTPSAHGHLPDLETAAQTLRLLVCRDCGCSSRRVTEKSGNVDATQNRKKLHFNPCPQWTACVFFLLV